MWCVGGHTRVHEKIQNPGRGRRNLGLTTVHVWLAPAVLTRNHPRRLDSLHWISILHHFFSRDKEVNVLEIPEFPKDFANAEGGLAETSGLLNGWAVLDPIRTNNGSGIQQVTGDSYRIYIAP